MYIVIEECEFPTSVLDSVSEKGVSDQVGSKASSSELDTDYDIWTMCFDGARAKYGSGIVFISPSREYFPYHFHLEFDCINNIP
jgi:hypothetical protein